MLEVRNLSFAYRSTPVLRDVSFVVSPGEAVSVVGANGAGKSTLLRVLATLAVPDSGLVLSEGQNAFDHPMRYRRQLGYMTERAAMYDDMTVRDYLVYRAELKGEPVRRVRRRVGDAVELCRIGDLLRLPIGQLSNGLRRRVALADALLLRPRVLLLDDFLAGLDRSMREAAGEILKDAAAFSAVIVTGHEIADFARWTTRFLVLREGVVAATIPTAGADGAELVARVGAALEGGVR